jgi:hypothetical protein
VCWPSDERYVAVQFDCGCRCLSMQQAILESSEHLSRAARTLRGAGAATAGNSQGVEAMEVDGVSENVAQPAKVRTRSSRQPARV